MPHGSRYFVIVFSCRSQPCGDHKLRSGWLSYLYPHLHHLIYPSDTLKHSVKGFSRTALSELQEIGFSQATVRIWAFQQRRSGACSKHWLFSKTVNEVPRTGKRSHLINSRSALDLQKKQCYYTGYKNSVRRETGRDQG